MPSSCNHEKSNNKKTAGVMFVIINDRRKNINGEKDLPLLSTVTVHYLNLCKWNAKAEMAGMEQ